MHKLSYYENVLHGTSDFPAAYYFVDEHHARYNMPLHWHKEWEIIHVLQGEMTLFADGVYYRAAQGDCFLLPDGTLHGATPERAVYECLVFDLHSCFRDIVMVKKYLRPFYRKELIPQIFYSSDSYFIPETIASLMAAMHTDCPELSVLGELCRLLSFIREHSLYTQAYESNGTDSRKLSLLKPVLEYIEDHYPEDLTLDGLSHLAGMNPKYFCRFFHSITGQTPMNYVNSYRIEQAALLLESGETTVTEAGLACGFGDCSYFIKCFKKYRGVTPKQYQLQRLQQQ